MSCRDCKYYDGDNHIEIDHIRCNWLYENDNKQGNLPPMPPYLMIIDKTMVGIGIGTECCYPKTVHKDTSLKCECFALPTP